MLIFKVIIWILVALVAAAVSYFFAGKNKIIKIGLQLVLFAAVVFLVLELYNGIKEPIEFKKDKDYRYHLAVKELIKIKDAQVAFKKEKGKFTPSFDSLIHFVKYDSITVIKREGEIHDSIWKEAGNNRSKATQIALKRGGIKRDTIKVSTIDSLFKNYDINKLGKIPFSDEMFKMDTATVETSGYKINVFEASVHNNVLLKGLNKYLISNLNDDIRKINEGSEGGRVRFAGVKVGSLTENNNGEGNWSKEYEIDKNFVRKK